jgi:ferritin-like metal-binding protein YciE
MKLSSLHDLLVNQLKDLYSAESQLVKALPKMAKNVSNAALRQAIENHLEETRHHIERLQQIGQILGCKVTGHKCMAMEGLVGEGAEFLDMNGDEAVIDAGVVAAAQRVELYEMSAYGTARTMAELLHRDDVVELLQQTLEEEKVADRKLTEVVENQIYPQTLASGETAPEHDGIARQESEQAQTLESSRHS